MPCLPFGRGLRECWPSCIFLCLNWEYYELNCIKQLQKRMVFLNDRIYGFLQVVNDYKLNNEIKPRILVTRTKTRPARLSEINPLMYLYRLEYIVFLP